MVRTLLLVIKLSIWAAFLFGVFLLVMAAAVAEVPAAPGFRLAAGAAVLLVIWRAVKSPPTAGPKINFRVVNDKYEVPLGEWYRLRKWESVSYFMFRAEPAAGWRKFSEYEPVVGLTPGGREKSFFRIFQQPEFRLYLQREPENPYDPHAIMVMGTAVIGGREEIHHLGYIERATAKRLARAGDLGVIPYGVWMSKPGVNYGLRIVILVRKGQRESARPAGRGKTSGAR